MVRQAHHERIISPLSLSLSKAGLTMKWTTFVALNRVIPFALSPSKGCPGPACPEDGIEEYSEHIKG